MRRIVTPFVWSTLLFAVVVAPALAQGGQVATFRLTTTIRLVISLLAAGGTVYVLWSQIKERLDGLHLTIIGLTVLMAMLHMLSGANDLLLYLNGAGYMALLTALYFLPLGALEPQRKWLYGLLIGYTLLTIGLYFAAHPWGMHAGEFDLLGWTTKLVEMGLVLGLLVDARRPQRVVSAPAVALAEPVPAMTTLSSNGRSAPPSSAEAALQVINLNFSYPTKPGVLQNLNVSIKPGERVGLIGPNGAGKTTFFMSICGVEKPESGQIILFDQPVKPRDFRPEIGMVFQNATDQLFSPTVRDDVAFGPQNLGLSVAEVEARVAEALTTTGVTALADRAPHHLSGGERRMVAIAGVIAMQPQLIIYDEPSANLDIRARRRLINFFKASPEAFIVSSHDLEFILEVCDRVLLLDEGRFIADGKPAEVMSDVALMEAHGLEKPHSLRPHQVPHHAVSSSQQG